MAQRQSVTSIGVSPEAERRSRFLKYTIAMVVRVICIILAVVVPVGWLTVLFAIGAIFMPYFAVIVANNVAPDSSEKATRATAPTLSITAADFQKKAGDEK